MQDVNAASNYKKYCEIEEQDSRLRHDLKRHNWLFMKLDKTLSNSDRSPTKAANMKPSSPLQKAQSAPKLRPTLPVCLPLSYHHKFLRHKQESMESHWIKHNEKSLISSVKNMSVLGTSNIIPQESKNSSKVERTMENFPLDNNTDLINENNSTDSVNLTANTPTQPLHVIQINVDYDNYKIPVPVKEISVQVPENICYELNEEDTHSHKLDITTIPLPLHERSTQTDDVNVIYDEDVELLRTVKSFNFTLEDLERFNLITFQNNNNQADFENQNETSIEFDEDKGELMNSDQYVSSENNDINSVEYASNSNKQVLNNNDPSPNLNGLLIKHHYQSSSLGTGLFERLKLWSDLNKVILRTFYEGVLLGKEKDYDTVNMENNLSQLSQNLVNQICDMVSTYNEAHGRQNGKIVEIIELDDDDDREISPEKRPSQDDMTTSGQINGTKKTRLDAQQHIDYTVQNNQTSKKTLSKNQEIQQIVNPVLETQNLVIQYEELQPRNQNEVIPYQITQNQGSHTQENFQQINPYKEIQNQPNTTHNYHQLYQENQRGQIPYHVNQIQMNPNQVIPNQVSENRITPTPVPPTRTQILQNQLLPAETLRNVLAPINEDRSIQNQMQNISPIYQERLTYTEVPERSTVLREFRMNSMPELDRSNKNDSRFPNFNYNSDRNQPAENRDTLYTPHTQNIQQQQKSRKRLFHDLTFPRSWFQPSRYHDFRRDIPTPINASYQTSNRPFQNVIQQNPQYNTSANYQNLYPYNYRNSYAGDYRRW